MTENGEDIDSFEIEKWDDEKAFRDRELRVLESRLEHDVNEANKKSEDDKPRGWKSPLVVAIFAAAVAATGNAVVSVIEGYQDRQLEASKAEQARILEMIKTGDPDSAATNLQFLLDAGLIADTEIASKIREFLQDREPGTGPALTTAGPITGGIIGPDDAVSVAALPQSHPARELAMSVGRLDLRSPRGMQVCTAFLIGGGRIVTAAHCLSEVVEAKFRIFPELSISGEDITLDVDMETVVLQQPEGADGIGIIDLATEPDARIKPLEVALDLPHPGDRLGIIHLRAGQELLAVWNIDDCQLLQVNGAAIHHRCDTGAGTSGSPIFDIQTGTVIGVHTRRDHFGGVATRLQN